MSDEKLYLHQVIRGVIEQKTTGEKRPYRSGLIAKDDPQPGSNEEDLVLELIGGNSHTGDVIATWSTTELAESKIYWGLDPDALDETMTYNNDFQLQHEIYFPTSFVGSNHYFKAWSRTKQGQEESSEVYGIYFIPGIFEISTGDFDAFVQALSKFSPVTIDISNVGITVTTLVGPDLNPKPELEAIVNSLSKPTPSDLGPVENTGFGVNVTALVT
jgi:hypothetical protein